ncbi:SEL1-like repeat protein [Jiella sonneratiae]|uniref:SEL1-like repeat protein n=1 Tax=Jiella sonneratiae TaxID=2816856 RepID=A0ABS3J7F1_9HYPH|nr:SEL1-like repeat protein [Jiella sonneratiae]MBO0905589.1 SEL1-like repeat protein [Jiella sonneratiae]
MTIHTRTRRLALLAGAAFLAFAVPANADQIVAQAAADCRDAKDHFEIARQINTPEAYQAHIDAFGTCPYASFARILKGQLTKDSAASAPQPSGGAAGAGGAVPQDGGSAMQAEPQPQPQPTDGGQASPNVAEDPFSGAGAGTGGAAGGAAAGGDGEPRPVPIPEPDTDIAAPAGGTPAGDAATSGDAASGNAPAAGPQAPTGDAKLLADTLVDRLNALEGPPSASGPRVRYDSAVLDQGDLFITNLRLTKDDGQPNWSGFVAPSAVVLKPKIEPDGTFTANSIFMTKASIRATEQNGPNDRVATISSISILDPRLAAVGAAPASDSLGPVDMRGLDVRSVVGFAPTGEILKIAAIQLTTNGVSDGLPQSATFAVKNLAFTPEQMATLSGASLADFEGLGPDFFDFTFTTTMRRDTAARNLKLTEAVAIGNEGSLTLSTGLANFTPADIRSVIAAANPAALLGVSATLESADLAFVNTSFVDKMIKVVARQQNIDPPLFKAAIPTAARDAVKGATGNDPLAEAVADALRQFLDDPRSIRLSVKPAQPAPIVGTAFQIAGSPDPVAGMAMLQPSLSVNDGPPVLLPLGEPGVPGASGADLGPTVPDGAPNDTPPAGGGTPDATATPVDPLPLVPTPDGQQQDALSVPVPVQPETPGRNAATAGVIADCDRLAADSDDPTKPADVAGVKGPTDIDVKQALPACEAAHRLAPDDARMTFQLGRTYQAAGRDDDAARLYREAADAGQPVAQYELALAYYDGRGVTADPTQAVEWLQKSSDAGNGFAKYFLGIEKVNGTYLAQDYPGAYALFQDAVAFGVPEALVELGKMEYSGQGVPENYAKAFDYYRQAAQKDVAGGYFYVGFMNAFGIGADGATPLDAATNMMKGLAEGYADAEELIVTNSAQIFEPPVRQAIQDYLRTEGFYQGRSDGVFGPATLQAINAWRTSAPRG